MNAQAPVGPATPAEAEWFDNQRRWTLGWRRIVMVSLPLVYLVYLAISVTQNSRGAGEVAGFVIIAAFVAAWFALLAVGRESRGFWIVYGVLTALVVAELPFGRAATFVMCVFLTMIAVARLGQRSIPIVIVFAVAALVVPVAVTSWHVSLAQSFADVTPVAIPVVALAMFAAVQVVKGNQALAEARAELARLAAENERIRIARDLHDLLGHSLTTITVKAGLARRLGAVDAGQANQEIAEVEVLARQSLADMRAAVSNYRDVTLTGELAAGRELLRAAGIVADLPSAADVVEPAHQELFGWVIREGLTNIVRHAHASSCTVRLSPSSVEILDDGDGDGSSAAAGHGLSGLSERVAAAGGIVDAGPAQPRGWRLRVSLSGAGAP
jgi:two-component system, NarL family, sensor histidine kinase DesK